MGARQPSFTKKIQQDPQVIQLFDGRRYQESQSMLLAIEENLKMIDDNLKRLSFLNREIKKVAK